MPPKVSRTGRKQRAAGREEEPSGAQLLEECVGLQEEMEMEQREETLFKMETNKRHIFWDNSKRRLEETKARLREELRLKQEAENHHRAKNKEYELKLKQLQSAHHNELCELKLTAIVSASNIQREFVISEVELQKKILHLQADKGQKQRHSQVQLRELQQKHQQEMMDLKKSFDRQLRDIETVCLESRKTAVEENKTATKAELKATKSRLETETESILAQHEQDWSSIALYNLTHKNGHAGAWISVRARSVKKEMQKTKYLEETLMEMEQKLSESHQQLAVQKMGLGRRLKRIQKMTASVLEELKDLLLKHIQLELKHAQNEQEYDRLQEQQTKDIVSMQQKSHLKVLVLNRKINAMTEIQEKEQLKLWVVLAVGQGVQTASENMKALEELSKAFEGKYLIIIIMMSQCCLPLVGITESISSWGVQRTLQALEELIESKDVTIKALKNDVSREKTLTT